MSANILMKRSVRVVYLFLTGQTDKYKKKAEKVTGEMGQVKVARCMFNAYNIIIASFKDSIFCGKEICNVVNT